MSDALCPTLQQSIFQQAEKKLNVSAALRYNSGQKRSFENPKKTAISLVPAAAVSYRDADAMNKSRTHFLQLGITVFLIISFSNRAWSTDLTVQIRSPKDESTITQEQAYILVGGKAEVQTGRAGYVDIFLVIDVSASTALYAGVDFSEFSRLPNSYVTTRMVIGRIPSNCSIGPGSHNFRISTFASEIVASRRLLSQLNPATTRVGVITFGDDASLRQPLTHDFEQVRSALDLIYKHGPSGKTNMVDAILLGTEELLGKGESKKYLDSIKTLVFLTDGFPTLPSRDCSVWNSGGHRSDH